MLVAVTCDCFNPPVKHSLWWRQLDDSRRLFQELKELSKPGVTHLGVPCATSVPLSPHPHYPPSHLVACRPFWASWLIFACCPQQCGLEPERLGWVGTRKLPCLPTRVSLSMHPDTNECFSWLLVFLQEKKKRKKKEKKGKKEKRVICVREERKEKKG